MALAAMLTACGDRSYWREGPGTSLYSDSLARASSDQEAYINFICQQSGFGPAEQGCVVSGVRGWDVFVHAGLNDIDRRCDAYLTWLDDQRRSQGPILQQISDVRTATVAIMTAAGSGVTPIAIAAAAFGLTSSSFSNLQSRLVLELNHSTVQTVVLSGQQSLRAAIREIRIDNLPAAIYVLRQYLRICTPFYIETQINTTITAFERGGPEAAAMQGPLASLATVQPLRAADPIAPRARPPSPTPEAGTKPQAFGSILLNYNPRTETPSYVRRALSALCMRRREIDAPGALAAELIAVFEETPAKDSALQPTADGKLDHRELEILQKISCEEGAENYYEAVNFPNGKVNKLIADYLSRALPPEARISPGAELGSIRDKIGIVRSKVASQIQSRRLLTNTITHDLIDALRRRAPASGDN